MLLNNFQSYSKLRWFYHVRMDSNEQVSNFREELKRIREIITTGGFIPFIFKRQDERNYCILKRCWGEVFLKNKCPLLVRPVPEQVVCPKTLFLEVLSG